jgi:hypothetical protein
MQEAGSGRQEAARQGRIKGQENRMNVAEKLKQEFNEWADAGRGDEMERHHMPIFEPCFR